MAGDRLDRYSDGHYLLFCEGVEMDWKPIEQAEKLHQHYSWGYEPEIGQYNMHWREDKNCWCFTWNQEPCNPTHYMELPPDPKRY